MKKHFFLIAGLIALLGIGCADFPTSYSRIEPDKSRLLDFIYEPAEAAPGDTVLCKAIFAGKTVSPDDLTWRTSYNITVNEYGISTAADTVPLEIIPVDCTFSDRTSCIAFRFVIPDDIVANSSAVPENWLSFIPDYYREAIPQEFRAFSKSDFLQMVDLLSTPGMVPADAFDEESRSLFPLLLQCFTVPVQLYCTVRGGHMIVSDYSVRYNSRFASIPGTGVPVNRNPVIDSIRIYAVEKNPLTYFAPSDCDHPFTFATVTGDTTVLHVEKDKSYFIAVFTGNVDTSVSIDAAMGNGVPLPEQHLTQWYLEFDQGELDEVAPSDLMQISGDDVTDGQHIARLYPSLDHAITRCTAWIEVGDMFLNELYRPHGSTLKELRFRFEYDEN